MDSCSPEASSGSAQAVIDGEAWSSSGAIWSMAGTSLQITIPEQDGWQLSLVAQTDTSGHDLSTALEEGDFPIEIELLGEGVGPL